MKKILFVDCDEKAQSYLDSIFENKYEFIKSFDIDECIRYLDELTDNIISVIICRTGGDEFVIFMPDTDHETARQYVNSLNESEDIFTIKQLKLSVSFGTSTAEDAGTSIEEAIALSDAEMYRNKNMKKKVRRP